jgi:hypothetical protein
VKTRLIVSFVLLLSLISLSSGSELVQAAPSLQGEETAVVTPYDETAELITPDSTVTHFATHGTAWVAEKPAKFKKFRAYGWGTQTKILLPGDQWVHIPLVYATFINGSAQYVEFVQFCADSTNGARSKPIQLDIWAGAVRIYSVPIDWPANNDINCVTYWLPSPTWYEDIGLSVLLHFGNTNDKITLYKGWLQISQ